MVKGFKKLGSWAFLAGVVLALVLGAWTALGGAELSDAWVIALVVIGLVVGFLNITGKETAPFLMSGAVLIIASAFGGGLLQGIPVLQGIFNALLAVFVPATIIVAIKNVFSLAKN